MHWIYDLPLAVLCVLLVALCVLFALGALHLVHRRGWSLSEADTAPAAAMHAFVSVVYAVALGLMVVAAQDDYSDVEKAVLTEANAAGDLYRTAAALEPATRDRVQREIAGYVAEVLADEWPALQHARRSAPTRQAMDRLARDVVTMQPATPREERVWARLAEQTDDLLDARRQRLFLGEEGVGAVTWMVILLAGAVTIGFACFFHFASRGRQRLLTALMATVLALMIFLLIAMDHPLWGRLSVQPTAFRELTVNLSHLYVPTTLR